MASWPSDDVTPLTAVDVLEAVVCCSNLMVLGTLGTIIYMAGALP